MRKSPFDLPRRFRADESAASVVEFAILTTVFLLLLLGSLAYGLYFGAAHSVQQLAADAARTSIAGLNATERNALVAGYIARNAGSYVLLDPRALSYRVGQSPSDPAQYTVHISYDASGLPIWNLSLPLPGRVISYTSTIRNGGM